MRPAIVTLLYLLAALTILVVYTRRAGRVGLGRYHVLGAAIWGGVGGVVGARLLYLLLRVDRVAVDPAMLLDPWGTTISWGAYVGGVLGFVLYLAMRREPVGAYVDAAGSTLGLGPFFGRLACFVNGDDYGAVTNVPWGVTYPSGSYAFTDHAARGLVGPSAAESLSVHPVQLYLAANGLLLFLGFSWLWGRMAKGERRLADGWLGRGLRPGSLFLLYWAVYGLTRFGWEFFREDDGRLRVAGLPDGQLLALVVGLAAAVAVVVRERRVRPSDQHASLNVVGGPSGGS